MAQIDKSKDQADRLVEARKSRGFEDAKAAATFFGWNYTTYSQHERGERGLRKDVAERYAKAFRVRPGWLMMGEGQRESSEYIHVMGRVGAGAEILPEFEQAPPDGLYEIEALVPLPDGMIGFEVEGSSMWPRYRPGDVIICSAEGIPPENIPVGEEAIVVTLDGRRFVKNIRRIGDNYRLESHNAEPIDDVQLIWASEVIGLIRARQWRKLNGK